MIYLLAISIASNLAVLGLFLRYLSTRDKREDRAQRHLLDRIQAPQATVLAELAPNLDEDPYPPSAEEAEILAQKAEVNGDG